MVDGDGRLDDGVGLLVLAALEGDAALAAELGGLHGDGEDAPATETESPTTAGSYLASISVEGFRGVGGRATLPLSPGPGLTVVVGRNGSGKSSFAEAAELAVTGENRRWDGSRSAIWRQGWRNLHSPDPVCIALEVVGDGPPCVITRSWGPDDGLGEGTWTRQVQGQRVEPIHSAAAAVSTYRPFLSYNELGSVIDGKPTELHDALHTLLGLDDLTEAQRCLGAARKEREGRSKATRAARQDLLGRLDLLGDERAVQAREVLRARRVDLDVLRGLAFGSDQDVAVSTTLRQLAALSLPPPESVEQAALELDDARERVGAVASSQVQASADLAALLRIALDHHAQHGDGSCPVCGVGVVDGRWRADADRRAVEAERGAHEFEAARRRVDAARSVLGALLVAPPRVLEEDLPVPGASEVLAAWSQWHRAVDAADVGVEVEEADRTLRAALTTLVAAAQEELAVRDEAWKPVAADLADLHRQLLLVEAESEALAALKKAEAWVKSTAATIRDERMRPFAQQSQDIWKVLRQQSNVDLGLMRLEGTANRRHAAFDVTVDDVAGAALGVMSQGELHSLALSIFLPRATVEESPFRYVLIDDPVQAMDPAKVDGLARVLASVARDRQVIVFSHDDRLAESVRRAQLPATVVEVVRGEQSVVDLAPGGDPVQRYLADASALVSDGHVPPDLLGEIVASTCRSALEAAGHAAFRRARLRAGDERSEVERRLAGAHKTHAVLTLAVFHDESRDGDLFARLNATAPRGAVDVVQACKQGAHRGFSRSLRGLIDDTAALCGWVSRQ